MYIAGYIVTGFLVAGAYAVGRLRGKWGRYERTALAIPLTIAALASPVQVLVGDWAARDVATQQPIKLAAFEGLAQTTKGAAEHILGWYQDEKVKYGIEIPKLLSLLAFHNPNATVTGPGHRAQGPPAADQRRAHRVSDDGRHRHAARAARRRAARRARSGASACPSRSGSTAPSRSAGPAALVALIAGWVTTEVGRQPWVVYNVMLTSQAVTGARRHRRRLRHAGARLPRRRLRRRVDPAAPGARAAGRARRRPSPPPPSAGSGLTCTLRAPADLRARRAGAVRRARRRRLRRRLLAAARRHAGGWASASATTPTMRWRRCGRPTTCG